MPSALQGHGARDATTETRRTPRNSGASLQGIPIDRHSPDVTIYIKVGDEKLSVAKVGPHRLVVREHRDLPPTEAELVIIVDGKQRSRTIMLPHGASKESRSVAYF